MLRRWFCVLCMLCWCSSSFAQKPLVVVLDWLINPNHAPLFVAQHQGFFTQQGLSVHLIAPANSADPLKLVASEQADIALSYQPQFMLAVDQGLPLVRIATLIATPLNALLVPADSMIKSPADLKNKKIGYTPGGVEDILLSTLLKQAQLSVKDVTLININYNLSQALLTHKVDAIVGVMRNSEPIELELAGQTVRAFYPEEQGVPLYDELIFVAKKDKSSDPRLTQFIAALETATHYLIAHPQAMWEAFAEEYPLLNTTLNKRIWFDTLTRFSLNPSILDQQRYQHLTEFMYENKWLKHRPPVQEYAVELPSLKLKK